MTSRIQVLERDAHGLPVFWVTEYPDGRVTVSDQNTEVPLLPGESAEEAYHEWKKSIA